jgi:hypothetical protein
VLFRRAGVDATDPTMEPINLQENITMDGINYDMDERNMLNKNKRVLAPPIITYSVVNELRIPID